MVGAAVQADGTMIEFDDSHLSECDRVEAPARDGGFPVTR
jgi:hypothetical protein